jgi:carbamoyl-phosphate synthase large subunit
MTERPVLLISAVCGDIGGSAVRVLRESVPRLIGCDVKSGCPVGPMLDNFFIAPVATDSDKYLAFLKAVISAEQVDAFLPISEPEIEVLNRRRSEIESLGVNLLLNNQLIIDNFLDKFRMVVFLNDIGIRTPKTMLLRDYDGSIAFPIIVKPRRGYGSKHLWKVEDSDDLAYVKRKDDGSLIVQEYLGSDEEEYTTGVFSDGHNVSSITFRRRLGFGGLSAAAVYSESPFLEALSTKIASATGLRGSINIQSRRLTEDLFVPFEINPRLSSTLPFRKHFGFDDAVWWLNILRGGTYSYVKKFKSGKIVRFVSDYYFDMEEVSKQ